MRMILIVFIYHRLEIMIHSKFSFLLGRNELLSLIMELVISNWNLQRY